IERIRTTARFVQAEAESMELPPGQTTYIRMAVDGTRFTGLKLATVYVQVDRPGRELVELKVLAEVREGNNKLDAGPNTPGDGRRDQNQKRLSDLEKKMESLMKEIDALRKELRKPQSALPQPGQPQ